MKLGTDRNRLFTLSLSLLAVIILWLTWIGTGEKSESSIFRRKAGIQNGAKIDTEATIAAAEQDTKDGNNRKSYRQNTDKIERQMRDAKEKMQLESQISSLLKFEDEQLMVYGAGLAISGNVLEVLYPRYLALNEELETLKRGRMDTQHPTMKAKVEQIDAMKQLNEGVAWLRINLEVQLETIRKSR